MYKKKNKKKKQKHNNLLTIPSSSPFVDGVGEGQAPRKTRFRKSPQMQSFIVGR